MKILSWIAGVQHPGWDDRTPNHSTVHSRNWTSGKTTENCEVRNVAKIDPMQISKGFGIALGIFKFWNPHMFCGFVHHKCHYHFHSPCWVSPDATEPLEVRPPRRRLATKEIIHDASTIIIIIIIIISSSSSSIKVLNLYMSWPLPSTETFQALSGMGSPSSDTSNEAARRRRWAPRSHKESSTSFTWHISCSAKNESNWYLEFQFESNY